MASSKRFRDRRSVRPVRAVCPSTGKKTKRERESAASGLGGAIGSDQPTLQIPHSENVMTDTTTKTPKARPVSFSPEELQRVIAEAVAAATAQAKAEFAEALAAKPSAASNGKSQASMQNEIAVVKAFKKAGFGNVTPHEDVRTFNRWLSAGYRPVEG